MGEDVARQLEVVLSCSGAGCPGVRDGHILKDWKTGTPPRGLTIRPWTRALADVELVVIGQNPGDADPFERAVNADHELHPDRAELLGRWLTGAMPYIPYWVEVDRLLEALFAGGASKTVVAMEGYYCQHRSGDPPPKSVREVFDHCSKQYLDQQLRIVKEAAQRKPLVVGLGLHVREWWTRSEWRDEFRFVAAQHPSGSNPRWNQLFATTDPKRLMPEIATAWQTFQSEQAQSIDLWRCRSETL